MPAKQWNAVSALLQSTSVEEKHYDVSDDHSSAECKNDVGDKRRMNSPITLCGDHFDSKDALNNNDDILNHKKLSVNDVSNDRDPLKASFEESSTSLIPYGPHLPSNNVSNEAPDLDVIMEGSTKADDDEKSVSASPGLCGIRNLGNTCFMNSGLQCLFATPSFASFFNDDYSKLASRLQEHKAAKDDDKGYEDSTKMALCDAFAVLNEKFWSGEYKSLKPQKFKTELSAMHCQFKGTQQHDCQEFLALVLDSMHEQLVLTYQGMKELNVSEGGTSLELHTSHSTHEPVRDTSRVWSEENVNDEEADNNFAIDATPKINSVAGAAEGKNAGLSEEVVKTKMTGSSSSSFSQDNNNDGSESRESGSPKSFDSSSTDEKCTSSFRQLQIPASVKTFDTIAENNSYDKNEDSREINAEPMLMDEDSMSSTNTSNASNMSNLVQLEELRRKNSNAKVSEVTVEDIIKEHKTLNVNMAAEDNCEQMNNEVTFDSEKFSRHVDRSRPPSTIDNLMRGDHSHSLEVKKSNIKDRLLLSSDAPLCPGIKPTLGLKEVNIIAENNHNSHEDINFESNDEDRNEGGEDRREFKRIRLDEKEKNVKLELEMMDCSVPSSLSPTEPHATAFQTTCSSFQQQQCLRETIDADHFWEKHLQQNNTVVARTFQGQFKSSITCSVCNFVSITFEPFMYLPVPLPEALRRQAEVIVVPNSSIRPTKFLVDLLQTDTVSDLKTKALKKAFGERDEGRKLDSGPQEDDSRYKDLDGSEWQVVETCDSHIMRRLEDFYSITLLKEERQVMLVQSLYLKEEEEEPKMQELEDKSGHQHEQLSSEESTSNNSVQLLQNAVKEDEDIEKDVSSSSSMTSCIICMEEFNSDVPLRHISCGAVMCAACIERSVEHYNDDSSLSKGWLRCPECHEPCDPSKEFVSKDKMGTVKPKKKPLVLNLVLRVKTDDCDDDNVTKEKSLNVSRQTTTKLLGHPRVVNVFNLINGHSLYKLIDKEVYEVCEGAMSYNLSLVDSRGKWCSRCLPLRKCRGCITIEKNSEEVLLQQEDTIAITFTKAQQSLALEDACKELRDESLDSEPRLSSKLTLDECLQAFSRSEILDSNNPWFCSACQKDQSATKTLTVWRFPDHLIIYLKRFVFVKNSCLGAVKLTKRVELPSQELQLTPYLSGPLRSDNEPLFELYGCVNHFGSVGGGHYTAYTRHLADGKWNYFDDSVVSTEMEPNNSDRDQAAAYVLFYKRKSSTLDDPSSSTSSPLGMEKKKDYEMAR